MIVPPWRQKVKDFLTDAENVPVTGVGQATGGYFEKGSAWVFENLGVMDISTDK